MPAATSLVCHVRLDLEKAPYKRKSRGSPSSAPFQPHLSFSQWKFSKVLKGLNNSGFSLLWDTANQSTVLGRLHRCFGLTKRRRNNWSGRSLSFNICRYLWTRPWNMHHFGTYLWRLWRYNRLIKRPCIGTGWWHAVNIPVIQLWFRYIPTTFGDQETMILACARAGLEV